MAKETYHGPLERVDECCWRIPQGYKPGMRVDGLIFSRRTAAGAAQEGPGAGAGRQRRLPAGHPARQPGHARHSLGLRLLHRRRLRDRSGRRRRHLARRRRLRHQLRRPPGALQPLLPRGQAAPSHSWSRSCSARCPPASASRASYHFKAKELKQLLAEGPSYLLEPRPGDGERHRPHRGARPARRRRSGPGQRPRPGPRRGAVRHARLGQPLPGSADRRSRLRRGSGRRAWAWKRTWSAS